MTQPDTTPEAGIVTVRCGTAITQGPDGRPWIMLQLEQGTTRYALCVDVATADQLRTLIPDQLTEAITTARRQATGLLLPNEIAPQNTPPATALLTP